MVKVFNKVPRTFLLFSEDKQKKMKIPPLAAAEVPDEFTGDITFRTAVACNELTIWQEAKDVDKAQRAAEKAAEKAAKEAEKKAAAEKAAEKAAEAKGE